MSEIMYICPNCGRVSAGDESRRPKCRRCQIFMVSTGVTQQIWDTIDDPVKDKARSQVLANSRKINAMWSKPAEQDKYVYTITGFLNSQEAVDKASDEIAHERFLEDQAEADRQTVIQAIKNVKVTTADLHADYEIIAPVFFQINDAGAGGRLHKYIRKYSDMFQELRDQQQLTGDRRTITETLGVAYNMVALLYGFSQDRDLLGNNHALFDSAFFIAVQELKVRAYNLGADAIVGMRQDMNVDSKGFQHFFLMMYGTAVRTVK